MKIGKIIAYILSQLLRLWVTASAAVMMYIPMSALAYAERGYKAIGGEMLPVAIVAVAVWYGLGWLFKVCFWYLIGGVRKLKKTTLTPYSHVTQTKQQERG